MYVMLSFYSPILNVGDWTNIYYIVYFNSYREME